MHILPQALDQNICLISRYMHVRVVDYLAGMAIERILIANTDMLCESLHDSNSDVTERNLIIAIDLEW
jgi:hypothetical protein